jgi:SPP1 gp7 family putative phage head morphogenesis protein
MAYRKPPRAQVRMGETERALRVALAQADRRYWDEVARAVENSNDPRAALRVQYPDLAPVERVYVAAISTAWNDAGAWSQWALAKRGRGLLLGARTARVSAHAATAPVETGALGACGQDAPPGRSPVAERIIAQSHSRRDRDVLTHAASEPPDVEAVRLILEGEEMVIPRESIERYAARHIPQLRNVTDERRRETCRDLITRAVSEELDVRRTAALLKSDGFGLSAWHRENIARTEAGHLYSHGSVARFRSSSAVTGLRYEAVMDDRTSDVCEELHGQVFRADDVDGVTPPLHFQCRSELQPVLFDETPDSFSDPAGFLGDESTPNPLAGFGALDIEGMPGARSPAELYRPLAESEKAEMRELYHQVIDEARRRWPDGGF